MSLPPPTHTHIFGYSSALVLFTGHDLEILELEFLSLFHRLTQYFRKEAEQREAERFMMLFLDYEIQEHKDDRESF